MEAWHGLMTTRLEGWVRCFLNLWLGWADLQPVNSGLVGPGTNRFLLLQQLFNFFPFFVTVVASGVGVDWLA
jgi:hypothetical protein